MRITINLASRPFADLGPALKRLRIALVVLAVAAIGLGIGLHLLHHKAEIARARVHSLDGSIAQLQQERQGYQVLMAQPDNAKVLTQADALNKLFDDKTFSWTLAMEDLETVLPGGVQVTTLEPSRDKKDGHITLHLRVVGPRDKAIELVENLEHSRRFVLPRITGEASETTGNGSERLEPVSATNRVNFDILADYNPAKPGELKAKKKTAETDDATGTAHTPHHKTVQLLGRVAPSQDPGRNPAQKPGPGLRRPPYPDAPHALPPNPKPGGAQ